MSLAVSIRWRRWRAPCRRRPIPRRASSFGQGPSPGHSAHVGQEIVVYYRWHPLHGRRLRQHYVEARQTGALAHVETAPGVVVAISAWMLDPVACVGMELGSPRASISALAELHDLLAQRGLRRSSSGGALVAEEEPHERPKETDAVCLRHPPLPLRHHRSASHAHHSHPEERGRLKGRLPGGKGSERDVARHKTLRPRVLEALDRIPRPKPHRGEDALSQSLR